MATLPTQTLGRFILSQERKHKHATGELSDLLSSIALAVKMISPIVATAGFKGLHGYTGKTNVQGEHTVGLDEEADEILLEILSSSGHFGLLVSEERDSVIPTRIGRADAKYILAFDPLDGSSNVGSNIPVGTIFGIFAKKNPSKPATNDDFMQPGTKLVAAGYSVYGAKTSFVYSVGEGVHGFTLDPSIGEFVLTEPEIRTPERGSIFSVNEGYSCYWSERMQRFVALLKEENKELGTPLTARYVGSLVADFDRNLRKGGIFLYPADRKHPSGKLRLLYECMPLGFITEQAGGIALNGEARMLDVVPGDIHQRSGFVVGSRKLMEWYQREMSGATAG